MVSQYLRTSGKSLFRESVHQPASSILSNIGTLGKLKVHKEHNLLYHADVSQGVLVSTKVRSSPCFKFLRFQM